MQTLALNAHSHEVMLLQRLLNKAGAKPQLGEDGQFGPRTQMAVIAYQKAKGISPANGIVGAGTWQRLGPITERMHSVTGYSQPTTLTCWSAAATMMTGTNMSVGPGNAALEADGSLALPLDNIERFVNDFGWRLVSNSSRPAISEVITAVMRGPVWVAFQGHTAHAVVASGVVMGAARDSTDTVFRIHDPWPPNAHKTSVYGTTYHDGVMYLRSVKPAVAGMIQYMAQP